MSEHFFLNIRSKCAPTSLYAGSEGWLWASPGIVPVRGIVKASHPFLELEQPDLNTYQQCQHQDKDCKGTLVFSPRNAANINT